MAKFALVLFVLTLVSIVIQMTLVVRYVWRVNRLNKTTPKRDFFPSVTVVLCLRGRDPSLKECIRRLLDQNYPNYKLVCVVDDESDPASELVGEFASDRRIALQVAKPVDNRCSLKNNSLVAAVNESTSKVIVIVDGDTLPDQNWLVDLVAPLSDENVVASSGNRWYQPTDGQLGSYVRYLWNMAAAPQMDAYRVTWGGSLAIKRSFVKASGLIETWRCTLFDDAMVAIEAKRVGKSVRMLPHLLLPNFEGTEVSSACRFIVRQLFDTRLYHVCFGLVVVHCLSVTLLFAAGTGLLFAAAQSDGSQVVAAIALAAANYLVFYLCAWGLLDKVARDSLKVRGHDVPRRRVSIKPFLSILVTQVVYTIATIRAMFVRNVEWRGINYLVRAPRDIEMLQYTKMTEVSRASKVSSENASI